MGMFDDIPMGDAPAEGGLFDDIPIETATSPAQGARGAAEDAGGTRQTAQPLGRMEYLAGLAQKAAQGITANFGEEAAATLGAIGGKLPGGHGKGRQELLREMRQKERTFEDLYPKAATGAEVAGAVAGGVNAGNLTARAVPWLANLGTRGVTRTAVGAGLASVPGGAADRAGRMEGDHTAGEYATEGVKGAAISGGLGALTGGTGRAAANVVGPWLTPLARELHELGVRLTPGEMIGGYAKRAEDAAGSIPFLGQMIRNRQGDSMQSLNRAVYDRALAPVTRSTPTARVPAHTEVGHDAIQHMTDALGDRYDVIVPRMRAAFDPQLDAAIRNISDTLPQSVRPQFADAIRRHVASVIDRTTPTGDINGRGLQRAFQGLRREAQRLQTAQGGHAYDYDLGEALNQTHDAMMQAAGRYTPARTMNAFRRLNEAYGNFAVVRDAASRTGSEMGQFGPTQLHAAVRAGDKSAGKGATARGTARMEELSAPAKSVMTRRVGDSGTPERAALIGAILAPAASLTAAIPIAGVSALYTRPGTWAFRQAGTAGIHTRDALKRAMVAAGIGGGSGIGAGAENLTNEAQ
jgi:hypothetical protein